MKNVPRKLSLLIVFVLAIIASASTFSLGIFAEDSNNSAEDFVPDGIIENIPMSNIMIIGDYVFDLNDPNNQYTVNNMIKAFQTAYWNESTESFEYYFHSPSANKWQNRVSREFIEDQDIPLMNGDGTYRYWNMEPINLEAELYEFNLDNNINLTFNHDVMFDGVLLGDYDIEGNELAFLKALLVLDEEDEAFIDAYFNAGEMSIELTHRQVSITFLDNVIDPGIFEGFGFTYDQLRFDLIIDADEFTRYDGGALTNELEDFKLLFSLEEEKVTPTF